MLNTQTLTITPAMLKLIAEIDEFKGTWTALGRLQPERLDILKRVATIESVGSSTRIEGAKLTDKQVEALLANLEVGTFTTRDQQEVAGYAETITTVFDSHAHMPITENVIRQLHRDLLARSNKDERHRGHYKTSPNPVEAFDTEGQSLGVVFQTASPFDTPRLMTELVDWHNQATDTGELHPLLITAIFSVVFLEIHPFQDGNGRLSRILTTLMMLRSGYEYVPYSSMESIIEHTKSTYYLSLRQTQATIRSPEPNWQPFVTFFLQTLHKQKQRLADKVLREHTAIARLPELSELILKITREHGRVAMADLVATTGAKRPTVKDHVRDLVKRKELQQHGAGRGTWYTLAQVGDATAEEATSVD